MQNKWLYVIISYVSHHHTLQALDLSARVDHYFSVLGHLKDRHRK